MSQINILGPVGYNPTGEYDNTHKYERLDVVYYEGSSYVALQESIGQLPTNTDYWDCIAVGYLKQNTYDSVAEMKADDTLKAGMYAQTVGYYEANDGGGATYKIVDEELQDDGGNVHELENGLKALLVIEDEIINVKQFGVKGNNVNDDTLLIQRCIDNNPNKTIFFPKGTYIITSHIDTSANNNKAVSLELDNYAVIKASANYNDDKSMICLGGKNYDNYYLYDNFSNYTMRGGTIDCNGVAAGISIQNAVQTCVKDIKVNHCPTIGINVINGANNNSADALLENCIIIGTNNTQAIGLNILAADNLFKDIRIFHCKYGVYIEGGGNRLENIHCLATSSDLNANYANMVAFYVKGNYNYFSFPYSDQYATGFYIDGLRRTMINDYYCYYWADDYSAQHTAVQCSARMTARINNMHCRFPAAGTNTILKVANTSLADGFIKELTIHNTDNLNDNNDLGYDPTFNKDPLLLDTTKLSNVLEDLTFHYNQITACDSVVNYNAVVKSMTIPADTNTVLFKLPNGFYNPNASTNIIAKLVNSGTYQKVVCYISTSGSVIVNTPTAISGGQLQLIGSALNTQFSS